MGMDMKGFSYRLGFGSIISDLKGMGSRGKIGVEEEGGAKKDGDGGT